jgi:putative FmdB family regulatory protein
MPIYEYQCDKCGTFEATQRITEKPLSRCPTCKSKVKKLISNTSFQLKGTGWYVTDYARKDNKDKGSSEKTASPKGEKVASSETKGDGKTTTSSDTKEKPAAEKSAAKSSSSDSTTP